MTKELIARLLDDRVTGFNLTVAAVEAADLIEAQQKRIDELEAILIKARPFINGWPQCRDGILVEIDAAIDRMKGKA